MKMQTGLDRAGTIAEKYRNHGLSALTAIVLCCVALPVLAEDYYFAVPEMVMEVFVGNDSSVHISYDITFDNKGRAIDVVDIGAPNKHYRLNSVMASVGGYPLRDIRRSQYVDPGFEVHLGQYSIQRGSQGTLHAEFDVPRMLYQDTTRDEYVSLRITPTWFGSRYLNGNTLVRIVVHVPAGIAPDEVLWHKGKFSAKGYAGDDGHVIVGWRIESVRLSSAYMVGLSFPDRGMSGVIRISRWELLEEWLVGSREIRLGLGGLFLAGFGWLFFRFTGGTGLSVFALLAAGLILLLFVLPLSVLAGLFVLPPLIFYNELKLRRRRARYLPAIAQVEGGGIKRGLTAQEAAVVLERPLGHVLGLVIFGLLKKGIVRQAQDDPLTVIVNDPFCLPDHGKLKVSTAARTIHGTELTKSKANVSKFYRVAAQRGKTVIHGFEQPFLVQLQLHARKPVAEQDFGAAMRLLIERVANRLTGFDLSDTRNYYQSVVTRATKMAREVGDVEMREQTIERDLEWLLMGEDLDDVFVHGDYRYSPSWTRGGGWVGSGGGAASAGRPDISGKPSLGDVAGSFASWSENTMGAMASAIQPGSLSIADLSHSGLIDLGGADRITGDLLDAFLSFEGGGDGGSGGDWGGGGGCACAGCACACACAGGGR